MTNTQNQRRLAGKEEVVENQEEYQDLRMGSSMLTGQDAFNSMESLTEVRKEGKKSRSDLYFIYNILKVDLPFFRSYLMDS